MTATYRQAVDDMCSLVADAWSPTGYGVDWPGVAGFVPPTDVPWMRVVIQHTGDGQRSLANHANRRRYRRTGTLWCQVFVPSGKGLAAAYEHAKLLLDAIEGSTTTEHCVWFRRTRLQEVGESGLYQQVNVLAEFTYDEVK